MKKSYQKPQLYFENFSLLESLAGCDLLSNFNEAVGCVAYKLQTGDDLLGDVWVFADPSQSCTLLTEKPGSECYGNPTPGFSIFSS